MNYKALTSPPTSPWRGEGSKITPTPPSLIGKGTEGLGSSRVMMEVQ